ncbi:MAG: SpoIID/LytB domain-containing protein [Candidatus Rifleibacteriota bacterium]
MMYKQRQFLFIFFLLICFQANVLSGQSFLKIDRLIRVGLASLGHPKSFRIEPSNGYIEIFDNVRHQAVYSGKAQTLEITPQKNNSIKIQIDGKKILQSLQGEFLFSPVGKPPFSIKLSSPGKKPRSYRGSVAVRNEGANLFAINQVDMEDYLKSVVPCEIFNRAPAPALEAQAIAARTYAVRNIDRHMKKSGYHLCDTVHCQVYTGIVRELKDTSKAVKATAGKVLAFGNEPVNSVYHSNCGGILISSSAAWGGSGIPYLVSHLDGIKGKETFCSIGSRFKKSRSGNIGDLPKPEKNLVVRSFPANTRNKLTKNYGHRVGMCQDGAIGMGVVGYNSRQILGFYYPGTRILTMNYGKSGKTGPDIDEKPIVLAMRPAEPDKALPGLEFPPNPTQIQMNDSNNRQRNSKSLLGILKTISGEESSKNSGLKKVFWNPAQPEIFKATSTN